MLSNKIETYRWSIVLLIFTFLLALPIGFFTVGGAVVQRRELESKIERKCTGMRMQRPIAIVVSAPNHLFMPGDVMTDAANAKWRRPLLFRMSRP